MTLVLLVCFCSGMWAQTQFKYVVYYTPDGKKVESDDSKALKFTVTVDDKKSTNTITACEPVRESDFTGPFAITAIDQYIGMGYHTSPYPDLGIADGVFNTDFWHNHLKGITFPQNIKNVGNSIVSNANKELATLDFSQSSDINSVTFSDNAFGTLVGDNNANTRLLFNDNTRDVKYSIRMSDRKMEITSMSTTPQHFVLFGSKTFGNLTGRLTSLGGMFKNFTDHEFSLAVTDGLLGLEDGALQGSSVVAVSLPKNFDMLGGSSENATCGTDVFTDCKNCSTYTRSTAACPTISFPTARLSPHTTTLARRLPTWDCPRATAASSTTPMPTDRLMATYSSRSASRWCRAA